MASDLSLVSADHEPETAEPETEACEATPEVATEVATDAALDAAPEASVPHSEQDDLIARLVNAKRTYREAECRVDEIKESLKWAKSHMEDCASRVMRIIDQLECDAPENRPLFHLPKEVAPAPAAEESTSEQSPDEAWRAQPIACLGLPPALEGRLTDAGLATVGALEDFRAANAEHPENWPDRIGPATVEKIEAALVAWLSRRPASSAEEAVYPSADEFRSWHDSQQVGWLRNRATELNAGDVQAMRDRVPTGFDEACDRGFDAFDSGDGIENCEVLPGPECDAWLLGWLIANEEHDDSEED